jgi:hypothetical protein
VINLNPISILGMLDWVSLKAQLTLSKSLHYQVAQQQQLIHSTKNDEIHLYCTLPYRRRHGH